MTPSFEHSISFIIPGTLSSPGVNVFVRENADGTLHFDLNVLKTATLTADLRGLFFHVNDGQILDNLNAIGSSVTGFAAHNVIDLGHGDNMRGAALPFDFGVEFGTAGIGKDDIQTASFTLSNPAKTLTLDNIGDVQFGARLTSIGAPNSTRDGSSKLVVTAPAAPDAHDDSYTIFEDGASGLDSPTHTPAGTLFKVLSNDTDADHNILTITGLRGTAHGTVQIIDGGAVLYTPTADYSGNDSFQYLISDGHGGTDFANVNVTIVPVADVPTVTSKITAGATVNQLILTTTATQTDADGSEVIDHISLGALPAGVTATQQSSTFSTDAHQLVNQYLINLPNHASLAFDVGISAFSREIGNGDQQVGGTTAHVNLTDHVNTFNPVFTATNASLFGPGQALVADYSQFFGLQNAGSGTASDGSFGISYSYDYKLGLSADFHLNSGSLNAQVPYKINVETLYNKSTDALRIETGSTLGADSTYSTTSPFFKLALGLIAKLDASADVSASIFGHSLSANLFNVNFDKSAYLVNIDTQNTTINPISADGLTLTLSTPNLATTGSVVGDHLSASGTDTIVQLDADVGKLLTSLLGYPGGLTTGDSISLAGIVGGGYSATLLNDELHAAAGLLEDSALRFGKVKAVMTFEDGTAMNFLIGDNIDLSNASVHDKNGDGHIDFSVALTPDATFSNQLSLIFSLQQHLDLLSATANAYIDTFFYSDSANYSVGPIYQDDQSLANAQIKLVGTDGFHLDMGSKTIMFAV